MTDIPDPKFSQVRGRDLRPDAVVSIALRDGMARIDETIEGQTGPRTRAQFDETITHVLGLVVESVYQLEERYLTER